MSREFVGSTTVDQWGRISILRKTMIALGVKEGEPLLVYLDKANREVIIKRADGK